MANKDYRVIVFNITGEQRDHLLAVLTDWPFNGFEEKEDSLWAYVAEEELAPSFEEDVKRLAEQFACTWQEEHIPYQNWNKEWESSFQPVQVGNFVGVRAEFHPSFDQVDYELLIHPRMAFGTGHHETTYLVMERMRDLSFEGKAVFDYGCGTGILAILAKMLGAQPIDAVDIEEEAVDNTQVNMQANQVEDITLYAGDITSVPQSSYDIILANINRNVILASLQTLYQRTKAGGDLLVSGILEKDRTLVEQEAKASGFTQVLARQKGDWMMFHFQRPV